MRFVHFNTNLIGVEPHVKRLRTEHPRLRHASVLRSV